MQSPWSHFEPRANQPVAEVHPKQAIQSDFAADFKDATVKDMTVKDDYLAREMSTTLYTAQNLGQSLAEDEDMMLLEEIGRRTRALFAGVGASLNEGHLF